MNRLRHLVGWSWLALLLVARLAPAATVVWSDSFETNGASRWELTGAWKIKPPTAGPAANAAGYRTHSGTNCASTQGYGYNLDGRLACVRYLNNARTLFVPTNQVTTLRFWQWFNFADALGYVEISTNLGSDWIQVSSSYLNKIGGGVWSRPAIDLTAYAGENIQIGFHFTSGACCGNGLGWFIDDVEVDTGLPVLNFPEGFESDPKTNDWSVDFGTWEIGKPTSGPGKAHTGTNCAGTVLGGSYLNNVNSRLISPPFVVPASGSPALRFAQWYSFNNALGFVELYNGSTLSTTTTNITITTNVTAGIDTNVYQFSGAAVTADSAPLYWNPTIGGWTNATRTLGSLYDYSLQYFYFEAGTTPLSYFNYDYRMNSFLPVPQSSTPTNSIYLDGAAWLSRISSSDQPVGYFGTNYTYTYTTNISIVTSGTSWTQISPTYENVTSSGWTNTLLDLSAYAGQSVLIAFHFTSGGLYTASGWYVDDVTLSVPPTLFGPTNHLMYIGDGVLAGTSLVGTNYATNTYLPNASYTFSLLSGPANASVTTQGVFTWPINKLMPSSTNTITVVVRDDEVPPLSATNSFVITLINTNIPALIVPSTQAIYAGQTLVVTNYATNEFSPDDTFTFQLLSQIQTLTNIDLSDFTNDGVITWPTTTAQRVGTYTNIIKVTDDVYPDYSATNRFLIVVSKPPSPVLSLPAAQTIYAGQLLDVFITATNLAFPDSVFTYTVTNLPPISINPDSGELTWQTDPTNRVQSVKKISVAVTDDHTPPLTNTGTFTVTISPTPAPTLTLPTAVTNYAGQQLTVPLFATNVARSDAVFTFALTASSTNYFLTNNASLNNAVLTWTNTGIKNGILYWTNNSVAPRTNTIKVLIQDDSAWTNRSTNSFALIFQPPLPPCLISPTNPAVYVGQTFTNVLLATNDFLPGTNFTFALARTFTNGLLKTNLNVLVWTNAAVVPGIYTNYVRITDDSVPPIRTTNAVSVSVLPYPSQLVLTNIAFPTDGGNNFKFSIKTPWTNTPWRVEATTNLDAAATDWLSIYTNKTGTGFLLFTDSASTNLLQRYYRAVFP